MDQLQFRKLMIDSRFRTTGTTSDFTFDLPEVVSLPPKTIAYVGDVCVPVSFYSVTTGFNDRFYFIFPSISYLSLFVQLPQGSMPGSSLGENIKLVLDAELVNDGILTNITYTEHTNLLSIDLSSGDAFSIISEIGLKKNGYQ